MDGLPLNEFRVLAEKSTSSPETRDEKNRKARKKQEPSLNDVCTNFLFFDSLLNLLRCSPTLSIEQT